MERRGRDVERRGEYIHYVTPSKRPRRLIYDSSSRAVLVARHHTIGAMETGVFRSPMKDLRRSIGPEVTCYVYILSIN